VDPDHVTVPASQLVREEVQHRLPKGQLPRHAPTDVVRGGGPDADDGVGEVPRERPGQSFDEVLHHPGEEVRSRLLDLFFDRSRDVRVLAVFDDRDTVAGPDVEARSDRVSGARLILGTHVAHSVAPGLLRAPTKDGPSSLWTYKVGSGRTTRQRNPNRDNMAPKFPSGGWHAGG